MRFLGNRLACHQEKETWIDCLCHMKTFIEWKREEADDSSCFVVAFSLYPVTIALQVFVVEMFFMNLLLILRCHWWSLKTTSKHWKLDITGFLNQFIFFFWEKKNLRGKNDLLMFKIETYNISIVNKLDWFNLSSGKNLCLDIGCPSEKKKSNTCFIWRKKKIKFIFTFKI